MQGQAGGALFELKGICKRFPGVLANDHVDLTILRGEIHALLGENGAGKTTLMNCLYGLYTPEEGQINLEGRPIQINSVNDAISLGIGMIHQHFMLIDTMTVWENMVLGMKSKRPPFLDKKAAVRETRELAERIGLNVDPLAETWRLPVGNQQKVEILKALYRKASLLILDEPTGALIPSETEDIFKVLRALKEQGVSIILITHKLKEAMEIADRVTVMRGGRFVSTESIKDVTMTKLASMMVGRDVVFDIKKKPAHMGDIVVAVENLYVRDERKLEAIHDLSFTVHQGEVLGSAGVAGNGQNELVDALTGLRRVFSGNVKHFNQNVTNSSARELLKAGLAHIPEDRHRTGLVMDFSVEENSLLGYAYQAPFSVRGVLKWPQIRSFAKRLVTQYEIKTPNLKEKARNLSGGNQQKLIVGREMERQPKFLVAFQPTRGLDVGATEFVQKKILEQRDQGAAVLLLSTELDEALSLSDRVMVLFRGRSMGIVEGKRKTVQIVGQMMAGISLEEIDNGEIQDADEGEEHGIE